MIPLVNGKHKKNYREVSQCLICDAPLGADSKDSGFVFCHEHMKCSKCGEQITAAEAQTCYDRFLESLDFSEGETEETIPQEKKVDYVKVIHARCFILEREPITSVKQSDLDFLNQLRLMLVPNMEISIVSNENIAKIAASQIIANMTIDQMRMHLCMIEACAACVKNTLKLDPQYRKEDEIKFQKERFTAPAISKVAEATRPAPKATDLDKEIELKRFMEAHGLTDKTQAKVIMSNRDKFVKGLVKVGMDEKIALEMFTKSSIDNGTLPR